MASFENYNLPYNYTTAVTLTKTLSILVSVNFLTCGWTPNYNLPVYLKSKPNIVSFKSALKAKSDILDKITFNGLQGLNKDVVNYIY